MLKLNSSTYYYKKKEYRRKTEDEEILREIEGLKLRHPRWGYRRIWAYLRYREKIKINRKSVYRIMKERGLLNDKKVYKAKRSYKSKPREILGIDMTKVFTTDMGWVNYIVVIDWGSREILGSVISVRCRAKEWIEALEEAINNGFEEGVRGKGVRIVKGKVFSLRAGHLWKNAKCLE